MKAILVFNYDLSIILKEWQEEGHSAHHLWGKTELGKYGIDVEIFPYEKYSLIKNISNKIKVLGDLDQQFRIIINQDQYDVVYSAHHLTVCLLAWLRSVGLFRKPVVVIAFQSFRKHFVSQILTDFFIKGNDKILCLNEEIRDNLRDEFKIPEGKLEVLHWCVDINYHKLKERHIFEPQDCKYILSTGKTYRDYDTLIEAFREIDYSLKILGFGLTEFNTLQKPDNVEIYPKFIPTPQSIEEFKNAYAVAIPMKLSSRTPCNAIGLTSLLEAMAMSKPVIMTKNKYIGIDVEKEGIGLTVELGDVEGWKNAILYLLEHPDIAKAMGQRGRKLIEEEYNLEVFSRKLAGYLKSVV